MKLGRTDAVAVTPGAWDRPRRGRDYDKVREFAILKIMRPLETQGRHGCTTDEVDKIVTDWAGPLAKWIRVDTTKRAKIGKKRTLILAVQNPAVTMELHGRLSALQTAVKPLGIEEVRLG